MAPAPAAMDVDHEGAGGGARNQSTMVVVKSEAVRTTTDPPVVDPEPVEDVGGDTTECSSSFGDTCVIIDIVCTSLCVTRSLRVTFYSPCAVAL